MVTKVIEIKNSMGRLSSRKAAAGELARGGLERMVHPPSGQLPRLSPRRPRPHPEGSYLRQAFTLHVGLDPLQPVRVLLLPHPFVHLGT